MQKIRLYIILLSLIGLVSGIGLVIVFLVLKPSNWLNIFLFYILIAGLIFSIFTLIGSYLRKVFGQRELLNLYFKSAVRQGLFLTLIVLLSLFLASKHLFSWLNAIFLVLAFVFLESYLITKHDRNS